MANTLTRHVLPAEFAAELRAARLKRGLGLREAARAAGVSSSHLCLVEQGLRCPSLTVARDLAAELQFEDRVRDELFRLARRDAGRSWSAEGAGDA